MGLFSQAMVGPSAGTPSRYITYTFYELDVLITNNTQYCSDLLCGIKMSGCEEKIAAVLKRNPTAHGSFSQAMVGLAPGTPS